ncbi:GNAT family N-acetyltransferase [Calidithermus timidus]|jgi:predicted N-acetyltransferase YhbS|uniref:GNAT family N-acetyltransferase n=1 Tax=Calidithermus timidus TaxID=307124 RepID=UPI00035D4FA9|nr:GNAT family N-acetyltransferase [Calidithermus timidus]
MLRAWQPSDETALLELWRRRWGERFPLDKALWEQQTAGDARHFRADLARVFEEGGRVVGAVSLKTPPSPPSWANQNPHNAWISFLLVEEGREGDAGRELLEYSLNTLRAEGFARVQYGGDPSHFFPGVPVEDAALAGLLQAYGFEAAGLEQDFIRDLADYALPAAAREALEASGLRIGPCQPEQVPSLLGFLEATFPGRWLYETEQRLKVEPGPADVLVLEGEGQVWGFAHVYHRGSRRIGPGIYWQEALGTAYGGLGPIGVSGALRGKGLGFALLCYGVQHLKGLGVERMVIDWTTLADFYGKIGFVPWRGYRPHSRGL